MRDATAAWREGASPVSEPDADAALARFVGDVCEVGPELGIHRPELHRAFEQWATTAGVAGVRAVEFYAALAARGFSMTDATATDLALAASTDIALADQPADRRPAAVYLARLAPGSRRSMRGALDAMAAIVTGGRLGADALQWQDLRYQHAQAIRTARAAKYSPATTNRNLSALRGVLREARRLGLMSSDDHARAVDLQPVRGETLPAGREVTAGELRALFDACATARQPRGKRDAALLAVLYGCGLRRSEAVGLDAADYYVARPVTPPGPVPLHAGSRTAA